MSTFSSLINDPKRLSLSPNDELEGMHLFLMMHKFSMDDVRELEKVRLEMLSRDTKVNFSAPTVSTYGDSFGLPLALYLRRKIKSVWPELEVEISICNSVSKKPYCRIIIEEK